MMKNNINGLENVNKNPVQKSATKLFGLPDFFFNGYAGLFLNR